MEKTKEIDKYTETFGTNTSREETTCETKA
jgi:hypothetical protein